MLLLVRVYSALKIDCVAYWLLFATVALNTVIFYIPVFLHCDVARVVYPLVLDLNDVLMCRRLEFIWGLHKRAA
jgi:hypothetical protein